MSTQTNPRTDVRIPTQRQRGGDEPVGSPTNKPHRGRVVLAITTMAAAGVGVAALWMSVGSVSETQVPNPGVEPFVSQVPQGIDGSDVKLYHRARERAAQVQAQQESAFGSDRRLHNLTDPAR